MNRLPFAVFKWGTRLSALAAPLCVLALLGYLLWRGIPTLGLELIFGQVDPWDALLGKKAVWEGLWPACVGTFKLVLLTMALTILPGIGCGIYLAELATPRQRRILDIAVDMLAGMPSIVMGLFGFMLILFLRGTLLPGANTCMLLAAVCLALMVLPVLIASTREAVGAVPQNLRIAAAALGMTRVQSIFHLQLPLAARGILGGVVLSMGRAAEDTAVIMLTGVVANAGMAGGVLDKFETLSFHIFYISSQYQDQNELLQGFGTACLLLCASCLLLIAARLLESGFCRRWQKGEKR
ncbi:MAG: ABC transporter permease subunit [Desulfovibrionaceae bacterium]|nr:ABC transporter permease subunit [Desulfovibrionaceae bacterium]